MALTDFTSYDDIRAVLGVSTFELSDETLGLEVYEMYLTSEMEDIAADLLTSYATVVTTAEASRTPAQAKFFRQTRLFATYATAKQLTASLPMFGPKETSDGKASVSRFADSPYRDVVKRIGQEYDRLKERLESAYLGLASGSYTATARAMFAPVGLDIDPVVG